MILETVEPPDQSTRNAVPISQSGLAAEGFREKYQSMGTLESLAGCARAIVTSLLRTTSDLVVVTDMALRGLQCSQACEQLAGVTAGELVGAELPAHFADSDHSELSVVRQQILDGRPECMAECEWLICGGRPRIIAWRFSGLADDAGRLAWLLGVGVDVTDVRQSVMTVRRSEERFALAVEGTDAGIWDWNLRANEVYFSTRWKQLLGYAERDLPS